MAPTSTLPDNPVYAFCPEYALPDGPQQIQDRVRGPAGLRADRPGRPDPGRRRAPSSTPGSDWTATPG